MKSIEVNLHYPNLGNPKNFDVIAYSDATYASLADGSSQGGFVILIKGENDMIAPVLWQSKKLDRVTKSPLASETLAASEAADAGCLIASMLAEIFKSSKVKKVKCFSDNKSLCEAVATSKIPQDRRLRVDIARIREMISKAEIDLTWVPGHQQLADCLTKRGASSTKLLEVLHNSHF